MKWLGNMLMILLIDYGVQFAVGIVIGIITIAGISVEGALFDVVNIIAVLMSAGVTIWFIKRKFKLDVFSYLHFSGLNPKTILFCVLIGLTYSTILEFVLGMLFYNLLGIAQVSQNYGTSTVFGFAVYAVLVAPVCEELIMRVGMIEVGRQGTSVKNAILASSIIFGILHFTDISIITNTICVGYLLAIVFVKTKNVLYPIIIHLVNNLFAVVLSALAKYVPSTQSLFFMELGKASFPAWWLIVVSTVVCLISSYLLWQQFDHRGENRIDVLR